MLLQYGHHFGQSVSQIVVASQEHGARRQLLFRLKPGQKFFGGNYIVLVLQKPDLPAKRFRCHQAAVEIGIHHRITPRHDSVVGHNRRAATIAVAKISQLRQGGKHSVLQERTDKSHAGITVLTFTRTSYKSRSRGKFRSQSARSATIFWFLRLIAARSTGVKLAALCSPAAKLSAEPADASQPFSPSLTHSRLDAISVTTTGSPVAMASSREIEVPSDWAQLR